MTNFNELGLQSGILKSIAAQGFETPTPIQEQAIPLVLQGHDIMGLAQTGTGKTAAFGLPLIHRLLEDGQKPKPKAAQALILAPTRELVNQIADNIRHYVKKTPLWISLVIGGQSIKSQTGHLARGTDILVATPGRLLDLVNRKALRLDDVRYLVLDEADQMLDLGFIHALKEIATLVGKPRQTLLFSATMPKQVEALSKAYLEDPVRVEVSPPGKAADKINQCVHFVNAGLKTELLKQCLTERENDLSLVFHRTKHGAEKLKNHLVDCGFAADSIHGNKSQGQRDKAIKSLKKGDIRILVATDVAARGIDIPGISHVYNYNLPEVPENYVHRIGRTARAGESGEAIAFCAPDEFHLLRQIERLMSIEIRVDSGEKPDASAAKPAKKTRGKSRRKSTGDGFNQRRERSASQHSEESNSRRKKPQRGERGDWSNARTKDDTRNLNNKRPKRNQEREQEPADNFVAKIARDQTDVLANDKPKRNRRPDSRSDNRTGNRSESRSDNRSEKRVGRNNDASKGRSTRNDGSQALHKPKRFKNKQMSVTEYDNREQTRKENRENGGENKSGTPKFDRKPKSKADGQKNSSKQRSFKNKGAKNPKFAKKANSTRRRKELS